MTANSWGFPACLPCKRAGGFFRKTFRFSKVHFSTRHAKISGKAPRMKNLILSTLPYARAWSVEHACMGCFVQWVVVSCLRKCECPRVKRIESLKHSKSLHIERFFTRCPRGHHRNGVFGGPWHVRLIFIVSWLNATQNGACKSNRGCYHRETCPVARVRRRSL